MRFLTSATLPAMVLILSGCLGRDDAAPGGNPYAGLDCERTLQKMQAEINAYQDPGLAKAAASPDTLDTAKAVPLKGWPPVAGLPASKDTADTADVGRGGDSLGPHPYDKPVWIPPVGYGEEPPILGSTPLDSALPSTMPGSISTVQIVTSGSYQAQVTIHDHANRPVREFTQRFGYQGELANLHRQVPGGYVSYLVWDMKDADGNPAETGVYLWDIRLESGTDLLERKRIKVGILTDDRCK